MSRLLFYLRYAYRNLSRSGRWTIFGIFCIAAGVAAIVALRGLGLSIADSLIDNTRASNHGDITLNRAGSGRFAFNFSNPESDDKTFAPDELQRIETWVRERGGEMTAYVSYANFTLTPIDQTAVGRPQFVSAFLVDPETFPPNADIRALDPAGAPLSTLLTGENAIVISQNLAESHGISVGDTVRVSGTEEQFTVRGIVSTDQEANLRNVFASFFGFAYIRLDEAETLQISPNPNVISLILPPETDLAAAERELRGFVPRASITTVTELLETNAEIGDYIGRFIVIMGLGALLIGGVGIINTMLVMVGRRTGEIATLKTFGLKGRQIAALFLAEAFLLGAAGSVAGSVLGLALTGLVNRFGEAFLLQPLIFRVYPEAILYGLGLGMVVTMVFGLMPVLTAVQIRPAIILRPNEPHIAAVGCLQSLLGIVLVILVIGGVAGRILGVLWVGIVAVAVTLLVLALLVGVMWLVVWIVGRLPAFGWVDMRLALRNLRSRRIRTATTLLALSAGMFALSSITFVGAGIREVLQFQLTRELGGNILVFPYASLLSSSIGQTVTQAQLRTIDGIESSRELVFYNFRVVAIDGQEPELPDVPGIENAPRGLQRNLRNIDVTVNIYDPNNPDQNQSVAQGRALTPADEGQRVLLLANNSISDLAGVGVGTVLTLRDNNRNFDFEVVGLMADSGNMSLGSGTSLVPPGSLGGMSPDFTLNILQAEAEHINEVLLDLSALVPPVLALDLRFIDGLLSRLIAQFSAIPILVGLLSLLAAAVIMANTVSLATLERRRQIGILKAIGLKGRRVLLVMLLENTLIGLLGGVLGIGISALGVSILTALGMGDAIPIPREATLTALALVAASVVIAWVATFASARVALTERVTNVLRYE